MDFVTTFFASGIEALTIYGIITCLDKNNQISYVKIAIFTLGIATGSTIVAYMELSYYFAFSCIMAVLLIKLLTGRTIHIVFIDLTISMGIYMIAQLAIIVIVGIMHGNIEENNLILFPVLLLLCATVWLIRRSDKVRVQADRYYTKNRDIIFWIAVNLFLSLLVATTIWNDAKEVFWSQAVPILIFMLIVYGLNIMLLLIFIRRKDAQSKLQATKEYQAYLESVMYRLSQERHEYKNQINTIIGLAQTQQAIDAIDAIIRYGEEILQKNKNSAADVVVCSDTLVGAALYRKELQAQEWRIKFEQMIETPFPQYNISPYDLTELLANLLNNAFEAVRGLPEEQREVFLKISAEKIEVLNALPEGFNEDNIAQFSKLEYSTKGKNRGYGMANIYRITDRYNAKLNIYLTENLIAFEVKL